MSPGRSRLRLLQSELSVVLSEWVLIAAVSQTLLHLLPIREGFFLKKKKGKGTPLGLQNRAVFKRVFKHGKSNARF